MIIFGIDPGVSGAISILENKKVIEVFDMPTMIDGKKNKRQINSAQVTNIFKERLNNNKEVVVVVEHVNAMPGQGVTSMFNFGQSFGVIKGVCAALSLPIYFVRPTKWKKHFNLIKTNKDASRTKVIEIFDMPTMIDGKKNKKQVNGAQVTNIIKGKLNQNKEIIVVVEHVTAMPGQGVTSMFNFGQSFGVIKGVCAALKLPIYFVRPTKWKKHFSLIKTNKDASRT